MKKKKKRVDKSNQKINTQTKEIRKSHLLPEKCEVSEGVTVKRQ